MSQPRNNLEALQHQIRPQQKSPFFAHPPSPKVRSDHRFHASFPRSITPWLASPPNLSLQRADLRPVRLVQSLPLIFLLSSHLKDV